MVTRKTKAFGIIAGVLFIGTFAGMLAMVYVIEAKESALEAQLRLQAERNTTERERMTLETRVAETEAERAALAQYMLTEDTVVDFLTLIETVAAEQGVSIETRSLAVMPIEGSETFEHLTLDVLVTGSFDSVAHMLALYGSLPYQVTVRDASIRRSEDEVRQGLWIGSYTLYVTKHK